jgi:hypothetical protein
MPVGPAQGYPVIFNGYQLPGYVQSESFDSILNIADHSAPYIDGSNSEDVGLANKVLSLKLKVWEQDYVTCKQQVRLASSMLRSTKNYAQLSVGSTDTVKPYYMALTKSITEQKDAGTSVRTLDYDVEFNCKPWLYGTTQHTLTGTGTITTDSVARDLYSGGWTPTIVTVTGTNVTVSGYTSTGENTGYISIAGAVAGLVIDTEAFTAIQGGVNKNGSMLSADYRMYVGTGKTSFDITGASSCSISYYDRWDL